MERIGADSFLKKKPQLKRFKQGVGVMWLWHKAKQQQQRIPAHIKNNKTPDTS